MNFQRYRGGHWYDNANIPPELQVPRRWKARNFHVSKMRQDYQKKNVYTKSDRYWYDKYGVDPYYFKSKVLLSQTAQCNYITPIVGNGQNVESFLHCLVIDHTHLGGETSYNILELECIVQFNNITNGAVINNLFLQLVVIPNPYKTIERYDRQGNPMETADIYLDVNNKLENAYNTVQTPIPDLNGIANNPQFNIPFHDNYRDRAANYTIDEHYVTKSSSPFIKKKFNFKASKLKGDITLEKGDSIMVFAKFESSGYYDPRVSLATRSLFKYTKN